MEFRIRVYLTPRGKCPTIIFLEDAELSGDNLFPNVLAAIRSMRSHQNWGGKLSKKVRGRIFEIRIISSHHYGRIFYAIMPDRALILFNGYCKTTAKLLEKEIIKAEIMLDEYNKGRGSYEEFIIDQEI